MKLKQNTETVSDSLAYFSTRE